MKVVSEHAGERRELTGQGDAQPHDGKRHVGQHLFAYHQQPENRGKGQEAWDFAHGLGEAGLEPLEAGALDRKVVEERRPARVTRDS